MASDHAATLAGDIDTLVKVEQIRLSVEQVRRIPVAHAAVDVCVSWVAWQVGLHTFALLWLAVMTICQLTRTAHVSYLYRRGTTVPSAMLAILAAWLAFLGFIHAVLVVRVFTTPISEFHYILTMIMVGNAAGAVSPAAGHLRSYLLWGVIFGGALAASWLARGTLEGAAIAFLLLMLFFVLSTYVRDQGRMLVTLVTLTDSLRKERDRAERASAAKTRFFAAASHDLRQPLTALAYNAATVQVLAADSGDEILARVGQGIRRALAQARGLLDSLLEVSKLDAGVVDVSLERVDVLELVGEVRESFAALAAERGLELRLRHDPQLSLVSHTDPDIVRRILHNLVDNAIKFTEHGAITLTAERVLSHGVQQVQLSVHDSGPGIAADKLDQVFEEFYQVGNAERDRSKGLGLGLSIVRRLAALLGIQVDASSTVGRGSAFVFALPCGSPEPPGQPTAGSGASLHDAAASGMRALLIDDEPDIRDSLQTFLATQGWQVVAVADLALAMEALRSGFVPDAIVVDFRLRDGASGLDALDAIRRAGHTAPAWLITGDTEPARIAAAQAAGVPVIYKPVDGIELARLMRAATSGGRSA